MYSPRENFRLNAAARCLIYARMMDRQMLDADFCLRKAEEYRGKAKGVDEPKMKSAYEAAAREYEARARALRDKKN